MATVHACYVDRLLLLLLHTHVPDDLEHVANYVALFILLVLFLFVG